MTYHAASGRASATPFRSGHPYRPIQFLQCSPLQQGLGGPVVVSCGDLPEPWISNDHKHAVISLR